MCWSAAASGRTPTLARDIYRDVKAEDAPRTVERMLKAYLAHRAGDETFLDVQQAAMRPMR